MLTVVTYHYIGMADMPHAGIHSLSSQAFIDGIRALGRTHEFVSLTDIVAACNGGKGLPAKACLISFDDGLRCHFEVAASLLDAEGVPAAYFVLGCPYETRSAGLVHRLHYVRASLGDDRVAQAVASLAEQWDLPIDINSVDAVCATRNYRYDSLDTAKLKYFLNFVAPVDFTDRLTCTLLTEIGLSESDFVDMFYMTPEMVRCLGESVGSHALSHRPLKSMSAAERRHELTRSRLLLEAMTGRPVRAVSYPLGNADAVDRGVGEDASAAGYVVGWTMERAINRTMADPLLLARADAADLGRLADFRWRSRYFDEAVALQ